MDTFLRTHPYLKPVNICNLYERLLEVSDNTMHLVYNVFRDTYEIHSSKSFKYNGESLNAVIAEDMLNGWLITDFLANNVKKFGIEIESERFLHNKTMEDYEDKGLDLLTTRTLKTIETMVGREI